MSTKTSLEPPIRVSEVQRLREVYRYLPPFAAPLIHSKNGENPEGPEYCPKPFSSSDRALNAFAQLGALRLRARRVIISCVDRTHQYILAESTKTLSSQDDDVHEAGDSLWMGVRTIPREESLLDAVIETPRSRSGCNDGEFRPKAIPKVINDLADDEILKNDPNVLGGSKIRFVATVPISSRRGFDIGAYSVFDDIPRNGLTPEEQEFLTDIADTVMEHLENIVVKRDHQRGEKMVKGLGLFVEGHSSIKSWWLRTHHDRRTYVRGKSSHATRSVEAAMEFADVGDTGSDGASTEANLSYAEGSREPDRPMFPLPIPTSHPQVRKDISIRSSGENNQPIHPTSTRVKDSLHYRKRKSEQPAFLSPVENSSHASPDSTQSECFKPPPLMPLDEAHAKNILTGEPTTRSVSGHAEFIKKMLARASNLIRESTDVDGVLFFDAKKSDFGSQGHQSSFFNPKKSTRAHEPAQASSSEEDPKPSRHDTSDSSIGQGLDKEPKKKVHSSQPRMCEVLAYSTATQCTLHGDSNIPEHLTVTENFVRRLFKRHPHGKIYAFDEEGHVSSSEDELHEAAPDAEISVVADASGNRPSRKASSRVLEGQTILKIFPGARFVMILPLWDSQRERWFANTMLWTSDPTRVLSLDDDLNYVAAFGNSIMAEVSRLDIVASDQTKTALISSISHEIRSPLHAIGASIELLQDTRINKYQMDVVNTIRHCSTTLLDTLNNVLDYAKINNFTAAQKTEQRAIRTSSRAQKAVPAESFRIYGTISLTSDLDIASITEDVIHGIYAGHVYALKSVSTFGTNIDYPVSPTKPDMQGMTAAPPLSVILDVDHKLNWNFLTQPGAWKRILMNIFGNALKFTTSGLVKVSLGYKSATSPKSRINQAFVTLTISDTGNGIAEDFLKNQIYAPFTQEDSLTPGAGLGLSIVRKIVGALDGTIEVHSVQGAGTIVKVVLKLEKSQSQVGKAPQIQANIEEARRYTHGLKLVLVGMETSKPGSEETAEAKSKHYGAVGLAISKISRTWFGMETVEAAGFDVAMGDVFLVTAERFYELEDHWKDLYLNDSRERHVIVLTGSVQSERRTLFKNYQNIHFLSNPIGPKTLADCFISVFQKSSGYDSKRFLTMPPNPRRSTSPVVKIVGSPPEPLLASDTPAPEQPIALLVEDNPINMKILIACMKKLKTQYYCAINGLQAVTWYKTAKKKPDVIFMDISMPVMNGFEASQRIRGFEKQENLMPTFIVAVTGLASDESQREAYNSGINLFMSKPVPLKDLSRVVTELSNNRRGTLV
ncbi:hypothetical protein DSL72_003158 [Monilinia vaccinii-corymbosi]|uniref:Histidine kinase n=1 Tax=Monilinia vaccinii-corymbosi TaxID=61207 RepID=A0A8A3P7L0_9HELO|nr:hypothetical protein DSL72_003158 [Monilinia vaccinii-corymbosi]